MIFAYKLKNDVFKYIYKLDKTLIELGSIDDKINKTQESLLAIKKEFQIKFGDRLYKN